MANLLVWQKQNHGFHMSCGTIGAGIPPQRQHSRKNEVMLFLAAARRRIRFQHPVGLIEAEVGKAPECVESSYLKQPI